MRQVKESLSGFEQPVRTRVVTFEDTKIILLTVRQLLEYQQIILTSQTGLTERHEKTATLARWVSK